jgi:tripeptidyl-peptidase-1
MFNSRGVCLFALAVIAAAVPAPLSLHELHEKRTVTSNWERKHRLHGQVKLPMRIGLTQRNLDKGHEYLMNVFVTPVLALSQIVFIIC